MGVSCLYTRDVTGKPVIKADSRPVNTVTSFTDCFDKTPYSPPVTPILNDPVIGMGKAMMWDFINSDDDTETDLFHNAVPAGYKAKMIKGSFIDGLRIKEGTVYFFRAPKGCKISMGIMAPPGWPYKSNSCHDADNPDRINDTGNYLMVSHYFARHHICGDCPMGDEFNTESCQDCLIPPGYELWFYIETPESDVTSWGYGQIEIYRERTVILP